MTRGIARNLTGERFGHLVALERVASDKQGNAQWLCKCDCGKTAVIRASFLKSQIVCSKQCKLNPAAQKKDISGNQYGELTAIKQVGKNKAGKALWLFKCSCGIDMVVPSDRVLNSGMKTCGKGIHHSHYRHGMSKSRAYHAMHYMKYMSAKNGQTPAWLTQKQIDEMSAIYAMASRLTKSTGTHHEVDHVYPLQGKKVSGLHVPENLKIVTRAENRRKNNKHPDDVC